MTAYSGYCRLTLCGHLFFQQRIDKPFSHQTVQLAQSADTRDACSRLLPSTKATV